MNLFDKILLGAAIVAVLAFGLLWLFAKGMSDQGN